MTMKEIGRIMEQETARVKSLSFHPSKPIIVSGHHSGVIKAWDYQMNVCVYDFLDHDGSVRTVLFHPRGDFFISGGDDKIIRIWNYTERRVTNRLKGHDDFIRCLDFHPTKPWILSASDDQTVMIWNMLTGKLLATARGHCHYVMSAKFLGEDLIVSGSLDQSIRIWDCKGLGDVAKKSALLPDIVIRQIVDGHDRGVNSIAVGDGIFVSGGDDRDVKVWEWSETSAWERESMSSHQGPVTGLLCSGKYILSCGEDGLFCIFDTERRKGVERRIEERYWCISSKENLYAVGHDSGFEVYLYAEPKIVCGGEDGVFYLRNSKIYSSNYKTEKILYKPKRDIVSMCSEKEYLLIQYAERFEILEKEKMVMSEAGEGVLFVDGSGDVGLIVRNSECMYRTRVGSGDKAVISSAKGKLFRGSNGLVALVNERVVTLCFIGGGEKSTSMPFRPSNVICSNNRVAVVGVNDVHVYDLDLNLINTANEMVSIVDGFFHEDLFIYATYKHLKYIFEDTGVLKSVEKMVVPFHLDNNLLYFLSDDGVECVDVDMTEIKFKEAVLKGEDIAPLIEGGALPGLAPLSYLIKQKKGTVALPYIKDIRQRFELCLSDSRLDECLEYCRSEGSTEMNRKLADAAIREGRVEIAEECLKNIREWNMLFMLYVCSKRIDKIAEIIDDADEATRSAIMLYLENREYFEDTKVIGGNVTKRSGETGVTKESKGLQAFGTNRRSVETRENGTGGRSVDVEDTSAGSLSCDEADHCTANAGTYGLEEKEHPGELSDLGDVPDLSGQEMNSSEEGEMTWSCSTGEECLGEEAEEKLDVSSLSLKETFEVEACPVNREALAGYIEMRGEGDIAGSMNKGLELTTEGRFSKAINMFQTAIVNIGFEIEKKGGYEFCIEERKKIGAYMSGLSVEKARRKTESGLKNIVMAKYFASLPLEKEHRVLASSTAIMVFKKHGNFKQAKELASSLRNEGEDTKVINKVLSDIHSEDTYAIPEGVFCQDVLDIRTSSKTCLLCFINSFEGDLCTNCKIGVLQ